MSNRLLRLIMLPLLALSLLGAACTDSSGGDGGPGSAPATSTPGERTFSGNGVSFSYPSAWTTFGQTDTSAATGTQVWSQTVGIDGRNIVTVSEYSLSASITRNNIAARADDIRAQLDSLFAQAGGSLRAGPTAEEMGGLPALGFTGSARNPDGDAVEDRLVLAFDGTTEYFVNCQYDDAARDEITAGCDRIVSTFEITG